MRLIWSALWEAFPREMHLISEFLIPSLRASALAPFAAPREVSGVEGGSQALANRARLGVFRTPLPPSPDPAAFPNYSRSGAWDPGQGPACGGEAKTPLLFLSGEKSPGPGRGNWKMSRRIAKGTGAIGGNGQDFHEPFASCTICPETHLGVWGASRAWFGLGACTCVPCGAGEKGA